MKKTKRLMETYPVRGCTTIHTCCLCKKDIRFGESYHDGGYGRRAHTICAMEEDRCLECGSRDHVPANCTMLG